MPSPVYLTIGSDSETSDSDISTIVISDSDQSVIVIEPELAHQPSAAHPSPHQVDKMSEQDYIVLSSDTSHSTIVLDTDSQESVIAITPPAQQQHQQHQQQRQRPPRRLHHPADPNVDASDNEEDVGGCDNNYGVAVKQD
ncbi:unnamed protein product, partial [Mesorhabditis spiculigera]